MVRKLFIGVGVDARGNAAIDRIIRSYTNQNIRWTPRENRHITMLFLGHVDDENLPDISEEMRDVSARYAPFDLVFDEVNVGPTPHRPKVLWLTGPDNEDATRLHDDLERALLSHIRSEKKRFRPHITLARLARDVRIKATENPQDWHKTVGIVVSVETVTLYESVIEHGKRTYVPIDVFEFVG